jgi:hypothetical protein
MHTSSKIYFTAVLLALCSCARGGTPFVATARPAPQSARCDPAAGSCLPRVAAAASLDSSALRGLAVDDHSVYAAGILTGSQRRFGDRALDSAGGLDVAVASFDSATHKTNWARRFGNDADQQPLAVAVTGDGTLAVLGTFSGRVAEGPVQLQNVEATPKEFLLGLRAADGEPLWGVQFDSGLAGGLVALASNPRGNRIAVCGYVSRAPVELVPGATFAGGARDALIAVFDSKGRRLWARHLGSPQEEECTALAIDDHGDVFAAGRYTGKLTLTGAPLPDPGSSFRRWLWVGKFDGGDGRPLAQASFGNGAGIHYPYDLAIGPGGELFVAGSMSNTLPFGGATAPLVSVGGVDAFVARLDPGSSPPFAPVWSVRLGGRSSDEARGLAVDAHGDLAVTGFFAAETNGAAALVSQRYSTDAFLLLLDGASGTTRAAQSYGDEESQAGGRVAFGRRPGKDLLVVGGDFLGTLDLGPAGRLHSGSGGAFLLFAE